MSVNTGRPSSNTLIEKEFPFLSSINQSSIRNRQPGHDPIFRASPDHFQLTHDLPVTQQLAFPSSDEHMAESNSRRCPKLDPNSQFNSSPTQISTAKTIPCRLTLPGPWYSTSLPYSATEESDRRQESQPTVNHFGGRNPDRWGESMSRWVHVSSKIEFRSITKPVWGPSLVDLRAALHGNSEWIPYRPPIPTWKWGEFPSSIPPWMIHRTNTAQ
jgi:hypothetical protein